MMNIEQIKELARKGESHHLELKKSTALLKPAFETLCAFLNCKGGTVLIGVTNDGKILGQEVTDQIKQNIANDISKLEPPADVEIQYVPVGNNMFIIVLTVKPGAHKPYIYEGRPFIREQTVTKRIPQQLYDRMVAERLQTNFSWEGMTAPDYSTEDLDENLLRGIVRKAVEKQRMPEEALRQDVPKLLEALKLLEDDFGVNNAAVALFGKKFSRPFLQCQLKLARFKGLDRKEFIDSNVVHGNIFELLENGMKFVRSHLPLAAKIVPGHLERVETPLIPYKAVREALINALCHRNYSVSGGAVGIAIYDDRMEIFNNGGLPPGVSLEKIKEGYSDPRNPLIANILFRGNLIEAWGRGVPEIIRSCLAADDPEPEFLTDPVEFKTIFRFPVSIKPHVYIIGEESKISNQLTTRQHRILKILSDGKQKKAKEIMVELQEPTTERTLRRDLLKLKTLEAIDSIGRGNFAAWFLIQKYEPSEDIT